MPSLNFQARFADAVERGEKCQTIRRAGKCEVGDELELVWEGRRLGTSVCTSIDEIVIDGNHNEAGDLISGWLTINGFPEIMLDHEAQRDGFTSFRELAHWFDETYGLPFEGQIIRWKPPEPGQ